MARVSASCFVLAVFTPVGAYVAPRSALPHGVSGHAEVSKPAAMQLPQAAEDTWQEQSPVQSSWNPVVLGLVLGLFAAAVGGRAPSALAADVGNGEAVFAGNCAACHAGGNNSVAPDKKLKKEELTKYGKYEPAQIVAQVTKGNGAMPAFGEKLAPDDIQDVAAYVRAQADKGW